MSQFRKYYETIFTKIVDDSYNELSPIFVKDYDVKKRLLSETYFQQLESVYNRFRDGLKDDILLDKRIFPTSESEYQHLNLNFAKMSAVICLAVLKQKPIIFGKEMNDDGINNYIKKIDSSSKDYEDRNSKIVNNLFVNYRIAVNAGLSFLFINYLGKTNGDDSKNIRALLNKWDSKSLFPNYSSAGQDTYIQTFIKTLVRLEYQGKEVDPVFLSLIFGSIQEALESQKQTLEK